MLIINNARKVNNIINFKFSKNTKMLSDPYNIPVFTNHPVLKDSVLSNYQKVLQYSNLKLHEQISFRNVKIYGKQYIHEIFTKNPKKSQNSCIPHLVFLHGFGGTSMTAIRLFEYLHDDFQVHALDIYGFGYSSRGDFSSQFNSQQTVSYYVQAIQQWRKAVKINKFTLVGHSFGGYISACYASKYPQRISNLILVSPAGASERGDSSRHSKIGNNQMLIGFAQQIYKSSLKPLVNKLKLSQKQQQEWRTYFDNVHSQKESSQLGFYKIFQLQLKPSVTIQDMIKKNKLQFPIHFYFGDSDWMPKDGAQRLVRDNIKNVSLTTIPEAGHQIIFQNPSFLCENMKQKLKKSQLCL